jgi:CheY-like chemotaxis protein
MSDETKLSDSARESLHDLNNILAVALAHTETLLAEGESADLTRRTSVLEAIRDSFLEARTSINGLRRVLRAVPPPPPSLAPASGSDTGRILLIDDDALILDALSRLLASTGYNVETAPSGEEGLARYRAQRFDCVVTDARLKGISGLIVSRAIKDEDPQARVVLLTGSDYDPEELRAAGIDRVLGKPTGRAAILAAVRGAAA